jgi:hypothetical protein
MLARLRARLTYANVVSTIGLFVALGGGAYAAATLPRNSVGTPQLKKNAVISSKVKDRSLLARDFKRGQLPAGPRGLTGPQGLQGIQGIQGPAGATNVVERQGTPVTTSPWFAYASCAANEQLVGGGYDIAPEGAHVIANRAVPDTGATFPGRPVQWFVRGAISPTAPTSVTAYAICASP